MFGTLQDRLPKELALAGITDIEAANRFIREVYLPAHNARFARPAALAESGVRGGSIRRCWPRPCASRRSGSSPATTPSPMAGRRLQLPQSPARAHYVKARVKVRQYPDGTLAVFHGPRRLARYDAAGQAIETLEWLPRDPLRRATPAICGQASKRRPQAPQGQQQKQQKRTTDVLPKPDNLISYRHTSTRWLSQRRSIGIDQLGLRTCLEGYRRCRSCRRIVEAELASAKRMRVAAFRVAGQRRHRPAPVPAPGRCVSCPP